MSDWRDETEPAGRAEGFASAAEPATGPTGEPAHPDAIAPPASETPPPRKSIWTWRRGGWVLLAVAVLAVAGTSPYWAPWFATPAPSEPRNGADAAPAEAKALESRLAALEARMSALDRSVQRMAAMERDLSRIEERLAGIGDGPSPQNQQDSRALTKLGDRLGALEKHLEALSAAESAAASSATTTTADLDAQNRALAAALAEQKDRLAKLETAEADRPDRTDAALLVAVGQLRAALVTSRPFAAELAAAEALARDRPDALAELRSLDARAPGGIPSLAALAERFDPTARQALQAAATPADDSWGAALLARLKGLVTVRRVGGRAAVEGGGAEATLAAAEAALKGGDLAGAVGAMKRLAGPAAAATQPWLGDAEARLAAESTVARLDAALAQRLSGAKP